MHQITLLIPLRLLFQEIHRVLRPEGEFSLWIYVLRKQYKLLQGFLNRVNLPHPCHFTTDHLMTVIWENYFEVQYSKDEKGTGLVFVFPNNTIKKALANQMMNSLL